MLPLHHSRHFSTAAPDIPSSQGAAGITPSQEATGPDAGASTPPPQDGTPVRLSTATPIYRWKLITHVGPLSPVHWIFRTILLGQAKINYSHSGIFLFTNNLYYSYSYSYSSHWGIHKYLYLQLYYLEMLSYSQILFIPESTIHEYLAIRK